MRIVNILLICFCLALSACSPGYVLRAAYEESKILLNRKTISKLVDNPKYTDAERQKFQVVLKARDFANNIGLDVGESFTTFSKVDRDVLVWVVSAAKSDSFEHYTWWFPIVGSVPYKGFFSKKDAERQAKLLKSKDYETAIYGSEAFSTLGWFNDPLLSTTLNNHNSRLVNTIIHESVHRTLWVQNYVAFNESLANFIGLEGALQFFKLHNMLQDLKVAELTKVNEIKVSLVLDELYKELNEIYNSSATVSTKLALKAQSFERHSKPLHQRIPTLTILKDPNNAEIMQLKLYMSALSDFEAAFDKLDRSWPRFLSEMKALAEIIKSDPSKDPFQLLKSI